MRMLKLNVIHTPMYVAIKLILNNIKKDPIYKIQIRTCSIIQIS